MRANNVDWSLTQACNFKCDYCHVSDVVANEKANVDYLLQLLNSTGKTWTITLSGGEPMIHPKFIEICEKLTKDHFISINTNLSRPNVLEKFVKLIDPKRVKMIDVSLHIQERQKRDKEYSTIQKNLKSLKENGFTYILNTVFHPTLSENKEDYEKEYQNFEDEIVFKRFKGLFNNKYYPLSYTPAEKKQIARHFDYSSNRLDYDYLSVKCWAGVNLIKIKANGDVQRCPGDNTSLGNLGNINEENVQLLKKATACNVSSCPCWGPANVELKDDEKVLQRAIDLYLENKIDKSIELYLQIEHNPIAANNLAALYAERNELEKAYLSIKSAFNQLPRNKTTIKNYLKILRLLGKDEQEILSLFEVDMQNKLLEAISLNPKQIELSKQFVARNDLVISSTKEKVKNYVFKSIKNNRFSAKIFKEISQTDAFSYFLNIWRKG